MWIVFSLHFADHPGNLPMVVSDRRINDYHALL
jgi:hypothetical protein